MTTQKNTDNSFLIYSFGICLTIMALFSLGVTSSMYCQLSLSLTSYAFLMPLILSFVALVVGAHFWVKYLNKRVSNDRTHDKFNTFDLLFYTLAIVYFTLTLVFPAMLTNPKLYLPVFAPLSFEFLPRAVENVIGLIFKSKKGEKLAGSEIAKSLGEIGCGLCVAWVVGNNIYNAVFALAGGPTFALYPFGALLFVCAGMILGVGYIASAVAHKSGDLKVLFSQIGLGSILAATGQIFTFFLGMTLGLPVCLGALVASISEVFGWKVAGLKPVVNIVLAIILSTVTIIISFVISTPTIVIILIAFVAGMFLKFGLTNELAKLFFGMKEDSSN